MAAAAKVLLSVDLEETKAVDQAIQVAQVAQVTQASHRRRQLLQAMGIDRDNESQI